MLNNLRHLTLHHLKASQLFLQRLFDQRTKYLKNGFTVPLVLHQVTTIADLVMINHHTALAVQLTKKSSAEELTLNLVLYLYSKILLIVCLCLLTFASRSWRFEE